MPSEVSNSAAASPQDSLNLDLSQYHEAFPNLIEAYAAIEKADRTVTRAMCSGIWGMRAKELCTEAERSLISALLAIEELQLRCRSSAQGTAL